MDWMADGIGLEISGIEMCMIALVDPPTGLFLSSHFDFYVVPSNMESSHQIWKRKAHLQDVGLCAKAGLQKKQRMIRSQGILLTLSSDRVCFFGQKPRVK